MRFEIKKNLSFISIFVSHTLTNTKKTMTCKDDLFTPIIRIYKDLAPDKAKKFKLIFSLK